MSRTVGIVGAGPVGLVTALRLASFGVASVVVEAEPGLRRQGSKACLIQGDVLEVLDKVGCAEQIAAEGVTWTAARTYVRGRVIRTEEYAQPIGFGPFVNISQYRIEQVLLARAEREPLITLLWSHRVTGVEQDAASVTLRCAAPDGEPTLRFGHLVACDGVRSTLRALTAVRWTGYTHRDRFLITDIRARLPLARERHFHYDPPFNPGRQLVMHPQPDDVWRIDWQLPPDADIDAERADGRLDRRIRAVIGDVPYTVEWLSIYRFHQRVVERMRVGRILFAGDAAHSLPPYGSRGMNSGIQDADNLAWKLAAVLAGRSADELLETYHEERYAAARENLRVTEATIRFMVPPSRLRRLARRLVLDLAAPIPALRRRVNSGRMAEPFVYADSPIVRPRPGDDRIGRFAPDGAVTVDGARTRMRRLFGAGFVAVLHVDDAAEARVFARRIADPDVDPDVDPGVDPDLVVLLDRAAGVGLPSTATATGTDDPDAAVLVGYPPGWTLVRPDGHIAAAGTVLDPAGLLAALRQASGAARPSSPIRGAA